VLKNRKFSPTTQHPYVKMTSYLTSSKIPFTEEDGHLIKAFQMEKHCTASQLLNEFANRNDSRC